MHLMEAAKPTFARHETFHPRYGWFRKAYAVAAESPQGFSAEEAPVEIGVGKNMVRSIRFWGLAAKLITEDPLSANPRSPGLVPTRIGHALFGESGWDRYMEDPGTLWLLHWLLLAPKSLLPVWWLAFNEFSAVEFADADLETAVNAHLQAVPERSQPHLSSLKKDVGALLRTYAPAEQSRRTGIDDLLDCPLRELNLIGRSAATEQYRFTLGSKPTLPPAIVAYVALDYVCRTGTGGNTITLSRLAHESGAPGRAFKLSEAELMMALDPIIDTTDTLSLATPTGAAQLAWSQDPAVIGPAILDGYYRSSEAADVRAGSHGDQPVDAVVLRTLQESRESRGRDQEGREAGGRDQEGREPQRALRAERSMAGVR